MKTPPRMPGSMRYSIGTVPLGLVLEMRAKVILSMRVAVGAARRAPAMADEKAMPAWVGVKA